MLRIPLLLTILTLLLTEAFGSESKWEIEPEDWPCGSVRYVFNVPICFTHDAFLQGSKAKRDHIANVFYQIKDNDEEGWTDDPKVNKEMVHGPYLILVYESEEDYEDWARRANPSFLEQFKEFQTIGLSEVFPSSCDAPTMRGASATDRSTWPDRFDTEGMDCNNKRDKTVEKLMHLYIKAAGEVYPETWAPNFSSTAGAALLEANGDCGWGYTAKERDASAMSCSGHYVHMDTTCNEECLVVEGIYWASATVMGGLYTKKSSLYASSKWLMSTPDAWMEVEPKSVPNAISLEAGSPLLYALVSDTESDGHAWLPKIMPDGRYRGYAPPPTAAPTIECVVLEEAWCMPSTPQGSICANEGQPNEAYCNYSFGPGRCVIGCPDPITEPPTAARTAPPVASPTAPPPEVLTVEEPGEDASEADTADDGNADVSTDDSIDDVPAASSGNIPGVGIVTTICIFWLIF